MKELPWEYCKCGCGGYELRIGDFHHRWHGDGFYRWRYVNEDGVQLNARHRWGTRLGTFKSLADVDDFVRAELKKQIEAFKDFL